MSPENRQKAIERQLRRARSTLAGAELLLTGGFNEDAVSRAYYCVFHSARAALASLGVQPRTHKGVNQRFNSDLVLAGKIEAEYASILGHVQMQRETADYAVETDFTAEEARKEVDFARRFLQRVEAYLISARYSVS